MIAREFTEEENRILREALRTDKRDTSKQPSKDEQRIAKLAKLSPLEFAQRSKQEARDLGITLGELNRLVKLQRAQSKPEPVLFAHWKTEPWDESVDGNLLLLMLVERIRRYAVISAEQAVAVALWVMLTWVHDVAAVHSPILFITSAEPNSGKSTLIGVIGFLVRRSLLSVGITGPALFRSIEKWRPTFAIDEADTTLANNDDLREVINSGWTRGQSVVRCDPETHEPHAYSSFAPKVIGMKGRKLPDMTLSRTIIIEMKRKKEDEPAADFDHIDDPQSAELRRRLLRWADDNGAALATAAPEMPRDFHNRVRANWKLLLAIAEHCGADWKRQAWQAAAEIEKIRAHLSPHSASSCSRRSKTLPPPAA
jgi:putative DNA primase/helicase